MEVSPKTELVNSQPFSVPFSIHNSGYLSFTIQRAVCYAAKVKIGNMMITDSGVGNLHPPIDELESGHNETVFCNLAKVATRPSEADIAIVVDYTPWVPFGV